MIGLRDKTLPLIHGTHGKLGQAPGQVTLIKLIMQRKGYQPGPSYAGQMLS